MPEVLTSGIEKVAVKNVRKHVLSCLMFSLNRKQITQDVNAVKIIPGRAAANRG